MLVFKVSDAKSFAGILKCESICKSMRKHSPRYTRKPTYNDELYLRAEVTKLSRFL
jgi:hypothetical protein